MSAAALLAAAHYGGEGATWQERLARALAAPDALFAIAEVSGQVVACAKAARCAPVDDDDAPAGLYLTGLLVDPAWRRRGLGEQLTRWRLERLRRSGEPVLFFTNARNTASLALHTRLGFVEVGRAASYLGEPFTGGVGVLMRWGPAGSP
ncbi:GNAT family N-acetyltransferase [Quadrisphaera setariae]|uniref:GNAT family N-acetyltransferase n=1 Tax=Quadrisphaera setariae TaxID=2593304 RepID=UPI001C9BE625|nr:GNAT family N-acetyltransferase [Quadrisphaera setariae]